MNFLIEKLINNKYVKNARFNGKPIDCPTIKYNDIKEGGKLEFNMIDATR